MATWIPRDRDFIKTVERLFFCTIGCVHPPDRVISYIKYAPSERGKWTDEARRYQRVLAAYTVPSLLDSIEALKKSYPHYIFYSDVLSIQISAVPYSFIKQVYLPREKLRSLSSKENRDQLQDLVVKLATLLSNCSGVPIEYFGVTGSILLDIHNSKFSDIDLSVYGFENTLKIKDSLLKLWGEKGFQRLSGRALHEWCVEKASLYPLTLSEIEALYQRKWNYGSFNDKMFSIHPVKLEVDENYEDRLFRGEGAVKVKATASNLSEALFLPHIHYVRDVVIEQGVKNADVKEITSYESFYGGVVEEGERVEAYGKLEKVEDRRAGETYHRVLIGSPELKGLDYVKPLNLQHL